MWRIATDKIDDNLYQVVMKKDKFVFNLPIQIGFFVYQYAKLVMLRFQYEFMEKFIPDECFELAEMDTDSSYFSLSTKTIDEAIRPELRREYFETYHHWFPSKSCERHRQEFIECGISNTPFHQQQCCKDETLFHKRTPGLFKTEFQGLGIVALCSKTYICFGEKESKLSCKGLQKKRNLHNLTREKYLNVLKMQQSGKGTNKGFVPKAGKIYTYEQERHGLSYLYPKRRVMADGISTEPLDL